MSLVWQSVLLLTSDWHSVVIPSQPAGWRGNPSPPSPRPRRGTPFVCCLRRGTFVTSDKSTQKRRLKLRFKTSSARYALPQTCPIFLAHSPFPCFAVLQKDCAPTAFRYRFAAAARCHSSSLYLYRRTGALPIPTQPPSLELSFRASPQAGVGIRTPLKPPPGALNNVRGATRRTYLLRCAAPQKARFDNRPPHRERVSKGRGRARPFPLDASRGWDF